MEGTDDNIFQTQGQVVAQTKIKVGKPPTRLQKKAPGTLEVAKWGYKNHLVPFMDASSPLTAIPLLSPLIISPRPSPQQVEEFRFPTVGGEMDKKGAYYVPGGWQHPAAVANGGYMEPLSLFTFFQSKCVLVNHSE